MRVLFIDIDTLRPDHMSCYGYHRNTTPRLDEIANEGIRFDNYYCSDAPCLPSRAALISGMFGIHNGAVGHGGTCADKRYVGPSRDFCSIDDDNNFNFIFRKANLHTVSISTFPERHSSWWFNAGFNEMYNVGGRGGESGEKVIPVALDWLDRHDGEDDWFMHLHLWDPHTPYRAPMEFGNPFENDPIPEWITEDVFKTHLKHTGPHSIMEIGMWTDDAPAGLPRHLGKATNMSELKQVIDGYDCGIRYADFLLGQVIDKLKQQGIYEDCAIIVTSDHGENMGELGIYAEHGTADHPTCHIPMIIKWPNAKKGIVDKGLHYNIDLLPTMADILNVEHYKKWDGQSYAQVLTDGLDCGRDYLVLSQMAHVCQRSARFGDWLYIRTYHDGYHLFDKEMLFNIKEDPYEQHDVKDEYPEICAKGAKIILDWHDEMMTCSDSQIDPLWTVMKENGPYHTWVDINKYLKRLEETGRADGAQKIREKYNMK